MSNNLWTDQRPSGLHWHLDCDGYLSISSADGLQAVVKRGVRPSGQEDLYLPLDLPPRPGAEEFGLSPEWELTIVRRQLAEASQSCSEARSELRAAQETLRDRFAIAALPALVAIHAGELESDSPIVTWAARRAYAYADAMLAARGQR